MKSKIGPKILIKGDIWSPSGYSNAVRSYIQSLMNLKYSVGINHHPHDIIQLNPESFNFYRKLSNIEHPDIIIDHETPEFFKYRKGSINIAYTVWEVDPLPSYPLNWAEELNKMDYIFTASQFSKDVFINSGVKKPIYIIPHIIDCNKFKPKEGLHIKKIDEEDLVFVSAFQWIRRKDPESLLISYLTEFTENDKVALVIKTYGSNFTLKESERIKNTVRDIKKSLNLKYYPKLFLLLDKLEDNELPLFYNSGDVFVSTSSGEGFSLCLTEAMSSGLIPIAGGSAQKEIVNNNNGFPLKYYKEPVYGFYVWYNGHQTWGKVDIMSCRSSMRKVYNLYKEDKIAFRLKQKEARQYIIDHFSEGVVGRKLDDVFRKIMEKRN